MLSDETNANEKIRQSLIAINSSPEFRNSERLQKFLTYIVNETLEGRGDRLKSYSIGLEVFGDNLSDEAVVRATAGRLRTALERYYWGTGAQDDVRIEVPKGRYIPEFVVKENSIIIDAVPHRSFLLRCIRIAILLLFTSTIILYYIFQYNNISVHDVNIIVRSKSISNASNSSAEARFHDALLRSMSSINMVHIFDETKGSEGQDSKGTEDIVLQYALELEKDEASVSWTLTDQKSSLVLWAGSTTGSSGDIDQLMKLADRVGFDVLGIDGAVSVIAQYYSGFSDGGRNCKLATRKISIVYDIERQREQIECLEANAQRRPTDPAVWGLLTQLYIFAEEARVSLGENVELWRNKARKAQQFSKEYGPRLFLTEQAEMLVAFNEGDIGLFESLAASLLERYAGAPYLKVKIGTRYIRAGQIERGRELVLRGLIERNDMTGMESSSLALADISESNYGEALEILNRIRPQEFYLVPLLKIVCYVGLQDKAAAVREKAKLLQLRPDYGYYMERDIRAHQFSPELAKRFIDSLRAVDLVPHP